MLVEVISLWPPLFKLERGEKVKDFKDFKFRNKRLSDLATKYISASFDADVTKELAMERDMDIGTTNRYRVEGNYFGDNWSDTLPIQLNIIKDPCLYKSQNDLEITKSELREITKWLTSSHFPEWIEFEYDTSTDENEGKFYCGWFNNIETWVVGGKTYGLTLSFKCTTPFAYTEEIIDTKTTVLYDTFTIINSSDEEENYCYPTLEIKPLENSNIYICNLSDCNILEEGNLNISTGSYIDDLLNKVEAYAKSNGYTVTYTGTGTYNIVTVCDDTAVQFYLYDKYNNSEKKCTAFYFPDNHTYKIVDGGFIYMSLLRDLNVYLDSQRLTLHDSLGRMITYEELGISDVDFIYWPRLINGENKFILYGKNVEFTFKHRESRKVGE